MADHAQQQTTQKTPKQVQQTLALALGYVAPSPTGPVRHEEFDHDVRARLVSTYVELTLKSTSPGGVDLWKEGAGLYQREGARFACLVTNCKHKGENGGSGRGGAEPAYKHLMAHHPSHAPLALLRKYVMHDRDLVKNGLRQLENAARSRQELVAFGNTLVRAACSGGGGGEAAPADEALARGRNAALRAFASAIGTGVLASGMPMNRGTGDVIGSVTRFLKPTFFDLMPSAALITAATDADLRSSSEDKLRILSRSFTRPNHNFTQSEALASFGVWLTCDPWTNKHSKDQDGYNVETVAWVDERWMVQEEILDYRFLVGSHSADELRDTLFDSLANPFQVKEPVQQKLPLLEPKPAVIPAAARGGGGGGGGGGDEKLDPLRHARSLQKSLKLEIRNLKLCR